MRIGGLLASITFVFVAAGASACAKKVGSPPPATPTEMTATAPTPTVTTPAPDPSTTAQSLYRWYCFADLNGAGTDCTRSMDDCQKAATDWANDNQDGDGVGDNKSSPCAGQQVAYCYSYVPDDAPGDQSLTLCQQTMDSCNTSSGVSSPKPNTLTKCAETQ